MFKALLLAPVLMFALPSCDKGLTDNSSEKTSTAIIQILPTTPALADPAFRTDNFIDNEIASLSMDEVIKMAAREGQWPASGADIDAIKTGLTVSRVDGTDMAAITATATAELSGKQIVDSLVQGYLKIRRDLESEISTRALDALDNELIAQSDLVQDHRKELTVLIQKYGIPYFDHTPNPLGRTEAELFADARAKHMELEIELALTKAEFGAVEEDPAKRATLSEQVEILESQLSALTEIAEARKEDAIMLSLKQNNYIQAKTQYEQVMKVLHEMKLQQQETRVALRMPMTPLVIRQRPN